jgi:hypothetical protein
MRKCLLFAPLVSHASAGRIAALINTGWELTLVDISNRPVGFSLNQYPYSGIKEIHFLGLKELDPFYETPSYSGMIKDMMRSRGLMPENQTLVKKISNIIALESPDIVFTFYGPLGIHFSRVCKKIKPELPVVFIANLIPSTLVSGNRLMRWLKKYLINEFVDYKNWINKMELVFCASDEMVDFIHIKFNYPRSRLYVVPDFHPKSFQVTPDVIIQSKNDDIKNSLIFLGAPERWGGNMDNIDSQLDRFGKAGISIYTSEFIAKNGTQSWHAYPYFSDDEVFSGKLSNYAYHFTAALVTYNINRPSERFRSTLPTRFFSALAAGLPIAVKGGLFSGVESFVKKYDIGFVFNSDEELIEGLNDQENMKRQKENVYLLLNQFSAEEQSPQIRELIENKAIK